MAESSVSLKPLVFVQETASLPYPASEHTVRYSYLTDTPRVDNDPEYLEAIFVCMSFCKRNNSRIT